jgi:hypothetical protein
MAKSELAQFEQAAAQVIFHVANLQFHSLGNICLGTAAEEGQFDGPPLRGSELAQLLGQKFPAIERRLGLETGWRDFGRQGRKRRLAPRPASHPIDGGMPSDKDQPRDNLAAFGSIMRRLAPGFDEGILDHFANLFAVAQDAGDDELNSINLDVVKFFQSFGIARDHASDQPAMMFKGGSIER